MTGAKLVALTAVMTLSVISSLAKADPAGEVAAQCNALKTADFSGIQDAPTQITEADLIEAKDDVPAYCRTQGYVAPQVGFEIRLPASRWNGKFMMVGCGGNCGLLWPGYCDMPLRKGYACIVSDMGHRGSGEDGLWAYNNLQAEIDYAYRATHVAALAGKAITERYYGTAPNRSYFMGCSQGGRQGLVEAQRFPWDFDGIVAGAPPVDRNDNSVNGHSMYQLWAVLAAQGQGDRPVLPPSAIKLMHDAVIAKCDLDDGVKDGIIGNPPACKFDPDELLCTPGTKTEAGCLTKSQAEAAKKIYVGVTTPTGETLYPGVAVGSELNWIPTFIYPDGTAGRMKEVAMDRFRYNLFVPDPGPSLKATDIDFARDYKRFGMMASLYSAANPDLRSFKAAGGKLIMYDGWSDERNMPAPIIDYYETVERTMGGRQETQNFFRLFMLPGMKHCSGGAGADAVDFLGYLEAWAEHDRAPDRLLAAHPKQNPAADDGYPYRQFPADSANVSFTRPVYPYPRRATYRGTGDPNNAVNFRPVEP